MRFDLKQSLGRVTVPKTTLEAFDLEVDDADYLDFLGDTADEEVPVGVDPSLVYPPSDEEEAVDILPVIENPEDVSPLLKIDVNISQTEDTAEVEAEQENN